MLFSTLPGRIFSAYGKLTFPNEGQSGRGRNWVAIQAYRRVRSPALRFAPPGVRDPSNPFQGVFPGMYQLDGVCRSLQTGFSRGRIMCFATHSWCGSMVYRAALTHRVALLLYFGRDVLRGGGAVDVQ